MVYQEEKGKKSTIGGNSPAQGGNKAIGDSLTTDDNSLTLPNSMKQTLLTQETESDTNSVIKGNTLTV